MPAKKPSDGKLGFIKFARVLTYVVYAYLMIAVVFLLTAFTLQLFGANPEAGFSKFVYQVSAQFLEPFRGIFPTKQVTQASYFNASALFAVIIYSLLATATHALINYITVKMVRYQNELIYEENRTKALEHQPQRTTAPTSPQKRPPQQVA